MKAILVIDTPKKCGDCKLFMNNGNSYWCVITGFDTTSSSMPNNCPLKPMPKKKSVFCNKGVGKKTNYEESKYVIGFNDCIDEILGDDYE